MEDYGKFFLRIGLGIVFLYFGFSQILSPDRWIDLIPEEFPKLIDAKIIIYLNGSFDILIGVTLILGLFIKIISILGFLHLMGVIVFSLGLTPSGIRDLGLATAILSLFFMKSDRFTLINLIKKEDKN